MDTEKRVYTFEDGTSVELVDIPPMMIVQVMQSEAGKPPVPVVEVVMRGHKRRETNPNDPDYLAALARWEEAKNNRMIRLVILRGVDNDPPDEFIEAYQSVLDPAAGPDDFKSLWITSLMPTADSVTDFMNAVMGQTVATEAGVAEAMDSFRADGAGPAD